MCRHDTTRERERELDVKIPRLELDVDTLSLKLTDPLTLTWRQYLTLT